MVSQFSGTVEIFDTSSMPWMFVRVPDELCAPYWHLQERGLIAVTATVGSTAWDTSLLPYGDRTHFIALPAKVRKKNKIVLGDVVTVEFAIRSRSAK